MEEQTRPFGTVEIQLGATAYTVAPASTVTIPFALINHTGQEDYFDITVEGIPSGWVLLDMPVMHLLPNERRETSITIQSPDTSPLSEGVYPSIIRAASQTRPDWSGSAVFNLSVGGYEATRPSGSASTIPFDTRPSAGSDTIPFDSGGQVGVVMDTLQFTAAPGESLSIPLVIANHEMVEDTFMITVEGLPSGWVSLPTPAVRLFPGEQRQLTLVVTLPQAPISRAGRHPFHLRVTSQSNSNLVTHVDGVLTVSAVSQFTADLNPLHIDAGRTARLRIHNLGNIQEIYNVEWQSPSNNLEFLPSQSGPIHAMPDETVAMDFTVSPRSPNWLGGAQNLPYTVLVHSAEGETQNFTGEVFSRSLIPVWVLPALIVFCLTAVCGLGFLWNWNQNRLTDATKTAQAAVALLNAQTATAAVLQQTPSIPPIVATLTPPQPSQTPAASATAGLSPTAAATTAVPSATPITPTFTPITPTLTVVPPTNTTAPTLAPPTNTTVPPTPTFTSVPTVVTPTLPPLPVTGQQLILFSANVGGQPQLVLMNTADGSVKRLTNDTAADTQPAWSPDGTRIAFTSNRDGNNEIYVMNADGSSSTNLTKSPADDNSPAWSPDGTKIAFTSNRDGNNEIYVMNADGSSPTNLTKSPSSDSKPAWYTQGSTSRILFTSNRDGRQQIYAINADGSSPVNLSSSPSNDSLPSVPPNGGKVAFVSDRDGNAEVYTMNLDGSGPTNLTKSPSADTMPTWSPDGKWIAFISNRSGTNQVYIMAADGKQVTNLSRNNVDNQTPAWH